MAIEIARDKDRYQIKIEGEMTIFVAQELKEALTEPLQSASEIEVDLSQVTEIDSAGLQLMLLAKNESKQRGTNIRFIEHSSPVQDILDLTDMVAFFGDPVVIPSQSH